MSTAGWRRTSWTRFSWNITGYHKRLFGGRIDAIHHLVQKVSADPETGVKIGDLNYFQAAKFWRQIFIRQRHLGYRQIVSTGETEPQRRKNRQAAAILEETPSSEWCLRVEEALHAVVRRYEWFKGALAFIVESSS